MSPTKFLLLSVFVGLISFNLSFAQQNFRSISGKVIEKSTKLPLEFAVVSLLHPNDINVVKETVTDKTGSFKLESIADGTYYLEVNLIGFEIVKTPPFSVDSKKDSVNMMRELFL